MIHPEFLGEDGSVYPMVCLFFHPALPPCGFSSARCGQRFHRARIREGVRGYFMEGSRRVAEAVVSRVIGLHSNPNE
jgi:hypothetical protein